MLTFLFFSVAHTLSLQVREGYLEMITKKSVQTFFVVLDMTERYMGCYFEVCFVLSFLFHPIPPQHVALTAIRNPLIEMSRGPLMSSTAFISFSGYTSALILKMRKFFFYISFPEEVTKQLPASLNKIRYQVSEREGGRVPDRHLQQPGELGQ